MLKTPIKILMSLLLLVIISQIYLNHKIINNHSKPAVRNMYGTTIASTVLDKYYKSMNIIEKTTNIYFLRIVKTGSTTLHRILARFAWNNNLRVATYNISKTGDFLIPPFEVGRSKKYHMSIYHGIYDPQKLDEILQKPTTHLSILRHPLTWLNSYLYFFKIIDLLDLDKEDVVASFIHHLNNADWMNKNEDILRKIHNRYSQQFLNTASMDDIAIKDYVRLDNIFLTGIKEYFDESLILFRRKLGWEFTDMIYLPLRVRSFSKKISTSPALYKRFCKWMNIDCLLFEHFNRTFWEKYEKEGETIKQEVYHFKAVLVTIRKYCSPFDHSRLGYIVKNLYKFQPIHFPSSRWHGAFNYTMVDCALCKLHERVQNAFFYYRQNTKDDCSKLCPFIKEGIFKRKPYFCEMICRRSKSANFELNSILSWRNVTVFGH